MLHLRCFYIIGKIHEAASERIAVRWPRQRQPASLLARIFVKFASVIWEIYSAAMVAHVACACSSMRLKHTCLSAISIVEISVFQARLNISIDVISIYTQQSRCWN